MRIVTLATCHNRREKTLSALNDLYAQELPESVNVEHVLVDDGSTDGTAAAVAERFPDVEIVPGAGKLFWAGGMRYGWEQAVRGKMFDYLLVYNDDVRLETSALQQLLETSEEYGVDGGVAEHVVAGAFRSSTRRETTYSGVVRTSRWNPLEFRRVDPLEKNYQIVDTINMNSCLLTKEALAMVGFLSPFFHHSGADYEYGLKLRKSGGSVVLAPGYSGICDRNYEQDEFISNSSSLKDAYSKLLSIKNQPFRQRLSFFKRHGGRMWVVYFWAPYLTMPVRYFKQKLLKK
jgi:GT2 family glycosyltransferase